MLIQIEINSLPISFANLEDDNYYDDEPANVGAVHDFNKVIDDLYADFPPTDPEYAYQNTLSGATAPAKPARPHRPHRPDQRPHFSRPPRPPAQHPVIETFEDEHFGTGTSNLLLENNMRANLWLIPIPKSLKVYIMNYTLL